MQDRLCYGMQVVLETAMLVSLACHLMGVFMTMCAVRGRTVYHGMVGCARLGDVIYSFVQSLPE